MKDAANIRVGLRIRPLNKREKGLRETEPDPRGPLPMTYSNSEITDMDAATEDEKKAFDTIEVGSEKKKKYTFDYVFDGTTTQEYFCNRAVFNMVDRFVEGINCTIFAYGQTGAGKSWSMFGSMEKADLYGAVPRSANVIFDYARKQNEEDASSNSVVNVS